MFGFILIRVRQIPLEVISVFTFHTRVPCTGLISEETLEGFVQSRRTWRQFRALLVGGYLEVMADARQLTDAHKMGLHLPIGTRNGTSHGSVPCHPLPANQTSPTYSISLFLLPLYVSLPPCHVVNLPDIMVHVFFASCSPDRNKPCVVFIRIFKCSILLTTLGEDKTFYFGGGQ